MIYSDVVRLRLSALCKERNITVNKLATLAGLNQITVRDLMNGKAKKSLTENLPQDLDRSGDDRLGTAGLSGAEQFHI